MHERSLDPLRGSPWRAHVLDGVPVELPGEPSGDLLVGLTAGKRDYGREGGAAARTRLREACGASLLVTPHQVHGTVIHHVRGNEPPPPCDALLVDRAGVLACVLGADCPGFLLAPQRPDAFVIAHSGWRGTAAGLAATCVDRLEVHTDCPPDEMCAWIGIGIGRDAYEVDEPVIASVLGTLDAMRSPAEALLVRATRPGHAGLDLAGIIALQLVEAGLSPDRIVMRGGCTHTEEESFHSYRRDGERAGRHLLFGLLR